MKKNKISIYEVNFLDNNYNLKTKYFDNKNDMDYFIFISDIYIIYIYNFYLHDYLFICDFNEYKYLINFNKKGV